MICTMYAPWFGELPFYSDIFLGCCGKSKNIQWIIHSNNRAPNNLPENVKWYYMYELTDRINKLFGLHLVRESWGHKLCDLKPFWHLIFNEPDIPYAQYRGWCDWDVVHDLSGLEFTFKSAKFSNGFMCSPLFIQKEDAAFEFWPTNFEQMLVSKSASGWDEILYLPYIKSQIIQNGMTPELDLFEPATYAVHMYRAKHFPQLYGAWMQKYLKKM